MEGALTEAVPTHERASSAPKMRTAAEGKVSIITHKMKYKRHPCLPGWKRVLIFSLNDIYSLDNLGKARSFIRRQVALLQPAAHFITVNGDFLSPSLLSSLDSGRLMVKSFNKLGVDFVCLGNHEFDLGINTINQRISELRGTLLNANAHHEVLSAQSVPFTLTEIERGCTAEEKAGKPFRIGWTGLVMETNLKPQLHAGVRIDAVRPVLEKTCRQLVKKHQADLVVALTHQPFKEDMSCAKLSNVHLVLGGHEHDLRVRRLPNGHHVVKAGDDARFVCVTDIRIPPAGAAKIGVQAINIEHQRDDEELAKLRAQRDALLAGIKDYVLLADCGLSSKGLREQQTSLGAHFCTLIKTYFDQTYLDFDQTYFGAELCISGRMRGGKDYHNAFTFNDFQYEFGTWKDAMVVVPINGREISDFIAENKQRFSGSGLAGLFQHDSDAVWDQDKHEFQAINKEAFDPDRAYQVCFPYRHTKKYPLLKAAVVRYERVLEAKIAAQKAQEKVRKALERQEHKDNRSCDDDEDSNDHDDDGEDDNEDDNEDRGEEEQADSGSDGSDTDEDEDRATAEMREAAAKEARRLSVLSPLQLAEEQRHTEARALEQQQERKRRQEVDDDGDDDDDDEEEKVLKSFDPRDLPTHTQIILDVLLLSHWREIVSLKFADLDTDGDGVLTPDDLKVSLHNPQLAQAVFDLLDKEGNGQVKKREFLAAVS